MKTKELRQMSKEDLMKEQLALLQEQFNLRMQKSSGQLTRNDQFKKVRTNIARVLTILHEKTGINA